VKKRKTHSLTALLAQFGYCRILTKGAVVEISGWMEAQGYQSKRMAYVQGFCTVTHQAVFFNRKVRTRSREQSIAELQQASVDEDDLPF